MTTAELDRLYRGRSGTYDALVTLHGGRYMSDASATKFAELHGTTLAELDEELWWAGWSAAGIGSTVHIGSLLAALGY